VYCCTAAIRRQAAPLSHQRHVQDSPFLSASTRSETRIPEGPIGGRQRGRTGSCPRARDQLLRPGVVGGHDAFSEGHEIFLKANGQKGPHDFDFLRIGTYNTVRSAWQFPRGLQLARPISVCENEICVSTKRADVQAVTRAPTSSPSLRPEPPHCSGRSRSSRTKAFAGRRSRCCGRASYYINPFLFLSRSSPSPSASRARSAGSQQRGKDPEACVRPAGAHRSPLAPVRQGGAQRHVVPEAVPGIPKKGLGPGSTNLNPLVYKVVIVPTATRVARWSRSHDAQDLDPFTVVSHDGFEMQVGALLGPRACQRTRRRDQKLGSRDLENNVFTARSTAFFFFCRAQGLDSNRPSSYQRTAPQEQAAADLAVRDDRATTGSRW